MNEERDMLDEAKGYYAGEVTTEINKDNSLTKDQIKKDKVEFTKIVKLYQKKLPAIFKKIGIEYNPKNFKQNRADVFHSVSDKIIIQFSMSSMLIFTDDNFYEYNDITKKLKTNNKKGEYTRVLKIIK